MLVVQHNRALLDGDHWFVAALLEQAGRRDLAGKTALDMYGESGRQAAGFTKLQLEDLLRGDATVTFRDSRLKFALLPGAAKQRYALQTRGAPRRFGGHTMTQLLLKA